MSSGRATSLTIETPEGVEFSFDLASPVTRSLAWIVDLAAIGVLTKGVDKTGEWLGHLNQDWATAIAVILYFAISVGYGIVLEWRWHGQTLGKRVMGLRVVDAQGLRLQLSQVILRNLLRLVDMLPAVYLVGGVACFCSRNCQRLGDLAAGTIVARERSSYAPDLEQMAPAKYNSLLAWPHLAARLRSLVSPESVSIAVAAVSRRDGFEPLARIELFRELAEYFQSLVEFPEAAREGLTGEQYVRSVLRVIYGGGRG
ncbi:MAG: RDD family protein [Bryobacteraceae bacterium]|jgi:uncharacterized RDD family membrane protein YckC